MDLFVLLFLFIGIPILLVLSIELTPILYTLGVLIFLWGVLLGWAYNKWGIFIGHAVVAITLFLIGNHLGNQTLLHILF